MTLRKTAMAVALLLGVAVPGNSALADYRYAPSDGYARTSPHHAVTGRMRYGSHARQSHPGCAQSSASEGNANQQNRIVKQYGQTSGGSAC